MARKHKGKRQAQAPKQFAFKRKPAENMSRQDFVAMLYRERTKSEIAMSKKLTKAGVEFEEQVEQGAYVVDFLLTDRNIILEIDGEYHRTPAQRKKDEIRTLYLISKGFRVIRLWNKEVSKCNVLELLALEKAQTPLPQIQKPTPKIIKPLARTVAVKANPKPTRANGRWAKDSADGDRTKCQLCGGRLTAGCRFNVCRKCAIEVRQQKSAATVSVGT